MKLKLLYFTKIILLACLSSPFLVLAQDEEWVVTTVATARANGDIYVDGNSDVYISDFGNPNFGNGSTVTKVTADGSTTVFASGLTNAVSGIIGNDNGDLFVATFNGGDVYRITANGSKTIINSGLAGPVGLALDNNNNLYVAECSANRISRLVNGTSQTIATIGGIGCANGLVWGHDNALYVLMWQNGQVYRVDLSGNTTLFATVPGGGGHLELYGDNYYVLSRTGHALYRVDFSGNVELFAGTGSDGNEDGPISTATLSRPNGIGIDRNKGEFYITGSSDPNLNEIPIRKISKQVIDTSNDFTINAGLAGAWVNPAQSGQGFVLDFALDETRFDGVLFWFTFNDEVPNESTELSGFGSTQSRWFTGLGAVDGAQIAMPIYRTSKGIFNNETPVDTEIVGSMVLEFSNCFQGVLSFDFTEPEPKSGEISIQRITPDIWCESLLPE